MLAIDPSLLTDCFAAKVESVLGAVKATARPGATIRLPGERSTAIAAAVASSGKLRLPASLWQALQKNSTPARSKM